LNVGTGTTDKGHWRDKSVFLEFNPYRQTEAKP